MKRNLILLSTMIVFLFTLSACSTRTSMTETQENPFFAPSTLPLQAPEFDKISEEHYLPAFEEGMKQELAEIEEIASNSEPPTFENTIVALEKSGDLLRRVRNVFYNLTSSNTNEKIQEIQAEMAPKLAAHSDNILLNRDLFDRVKTLYDNRDDLGLDVASRKLLEDTYRSFVRAGAMLSEEDQEQMREINEQLSSLSTQFQENLLAMTRNGAVLVDDVEMLDGLSEDQIEAAQEAAEERDHEGQYLLSITNTTRVPILKYLDKRELRQRIWEASAYRGIGENGGIDNRPLVLEIVKLRADKAALLGYEDWAAYRHEVQTAKTTEAVLDMLTDLIPPVIANTGREAALITEKMQEDGIGDALRPWDWMYYAEKVRQEQYDIDDSEVRPYFELNSVLENGVFYTMNNLFGITFEERFDLPVYHPDVRVFNVYDKDGTQIGLFYADYLERDSKAGGAWMNEFVTQSHLLNQKPVIVNVMNIPEPAEGDPALMSFDQVQTMFHEMGHAVHGLLSDVKYPSQSGTSVPRDFVEYPSTFEEDWAIQSDVLENYALHYETGERIPQELLDKVIAARDFNQGFDTQEYLAATMLDLEWHQLTSDEIPDNVVEFENEALAKYNLDMEAVPPRYKTPYYTHIFVHGYSAGYYSYIWSEVLAADAFAYMQQNGGLTLENGNRFREYILSQGGSREPMEMYQDYRGDEPDVTHLLERRGLVVE